MSIGEPKFIPELPKNNVSNEREKFLKIIASYSSAYRQIPAEVLEDKEFVLEAASRFCVIDILKLLPEKMRKDRDVVLAAVKTSGFNLEDASEELRADREIVMAAVEQDGGALEFAVEELKDDKEIVLRAVRTRATAFRDASERLQADKDILVEAAKTDPKVIILMPEEIRKEIEDIIKNNI